MRAFPQTSPARVRTAAVFGALLALLVAAPAPAGASLAEELGRNAVRIYAAPFVVEPGTTVVASALPERLDRLGYRRVRGRRPAEPGEYFWGFERFWVYRHAHAYGARRHAAELIGLRLERGSGRVLGTASPDEPEGEPAVQPDPPAPFRLEPELLAESFEAGRAPRLAIDLAALPEHVWRTVLAIEDARFFQHDGVDPRSVARAALKNARSGRVVQGGSTITQQLVKLRDLSPRRTLGRKVSEAARAVALEAQHPKEEILAAYLDSVYFGHVDGVSIYGLGAAARAFFDKPAARLDLAEAALLAGMIQGPNRLHPVRNPENALARQRLVLTRMEELGWAAPDDLAAARRAGLPRIRARAPEPVAGRALLTAIEAETTLRAPGRRSKGRGVVVETTLDPWLQELAETAVEDGMRRLRDRRPVLRRSSLGAALVALDARSGDILAYVGGDPAGGGDDFDRVRRARRQPGSTVKPFVALEALDRCGSRRAVRPSQRIVDRPLTIDLPSGPWSPRNSTGRFAGTVTLERAVAESLNVPMVRLARWCGFADVASRFRAVGLDPGTDPQPAFVLGAVEVTPLELAGAYSLLANPGYRVDPRLLARVEAPSGRRLHRARVKRRKTVRPRSAWEVRRILAEAMESGASRAARVDAAGAFGKTGTSSDRRDAWFAGGAGSVVTVVWVGLDDGAPLGLGGAEAAAPIWREFMRRAVGGRESVAPRPAGGGLRLRAPSWGTIE